MKSRIQKHLLEVALVVVITGIFGDLLAAETACITDAEYQKNEGIVNFYDLSNVMQEKQEAYQRLSEQMDSLHECKTKSLFGNCNSIVNEYNYAVKKYDLANKRLEAAQGMQPLIFSLKKRMALPRC